jgi:hypothetical protein
MLYKTGLLGVHSSGELTVKVNEDPLVPVAVALASLEFSS